MSMVVNSWMGELTKLTDKIRLKKKHQQLPNFFIKSRTTEADLDDQIAEQTESGIRQLMEVQKPGSSVLLKSTAVTENELPEETVFWLMDRFAPC